MNRRQVRGRGRDSPRIGTRRPARSCAEAAPNRPVGPSAQREARAPPAPSGRLPATAPTTAPAEPPIANPNIGKMKKLSPLSILATGDVMTIAETSPALAPIMEPSPCPRTRRAGGSSVRTSNRRHWPSERGGRGWRRSIQRTPPWSERRGRDRRAGIPGTAPRAGLRGEREPGCPAPRAAWKVNECRASVARATTGWRHAIRASAKAPARFHADPIGRNAHARAWSRPAVAFLSHSDLLRADDRPRP